MTTTKMLERDENSILHVVALSGGHDSTAMSFLLKEREPRPYNYVCTPTGNELPEMFEHWLHLGQLLGQRLLPIVGGTLHGIIREENRIPSFRMRFCTRRLKIEPFIKFIKEQTRFGPVVSYVGLRADESGRAGGAYDDLPGVTMRFPLREWNIDEAGVQTTLGRLGIIVPNRTDCGECYHQRLGEWYEYWRDHRDLAERASALEVELGHTFRTPGRDAWPTPLRELFAEFAHGRVPEVSLARMKRERMAIGACRVCSL